MSCYNKPTLTAEQQADLLLARGLIADRSTLIKRLQAVSYYRLSGYLYPMRQRDPQGAALDVFIPGTQLESVWGLYNFDRRLRVLVLDVIERIEVAVRTHLVERFALAYGPFGYLEPSHLPGFKKISDYLEWRMKLVREAQRSGNELFVQHFFDKYGSDHKELPIWMVAELMTFGSTLTFARSIPAPMQQSLAAAFGLPDELFLSWLLSLNSLRNACAHHSRVWNRVFGTTPKEPGRNNFPKWHAQPVIPRERIGYLLTICHFWLGKISPTSQWRNRLWHLFDEYPQTPLAGMGLPQNWREHPLWKV